KRFAHMRDVCEDITHFLAPSKSIRDRFVQFGIPESKITLSPYGVGQTSGPPVERSASRTLRLGFLGSLMVSKAPHLLLEAAARLPAGSVSVDLFGDHVDYHGDATYRDRLASWLTT